MTAYIIKSSLSLILLFGLYWFLLRKEKLFVFNRFFLIASVVFSLLVPFISIPVNFQTTPKLENFIPSYNYITPDIITTNDNVVQNVVNSDQPYIQKETPLINISVVLLLLYFSGVSLFLIRFLKNLFLIIQRSKSSEKSFNGYQIILTNDQTGPCCFFDHIFLNREDYKNGKIDKDLFNHEMEHARQSHTIDIILIELVKVFYWFNPIYLLYERAIRINHEYLADNRVINDNSDIKSYADKLLNFITCRSNMSLTSGSSNSFIKMRLMMMMKSHKGNCKYGVRITIILCMVTTFFILLSFKKSNYQTLATNPSQTVIDIQQNNVTKENDITESRHSLSSPKTAPIDTLVYQDSLTNKILVECADACFVLKDKMNNEVIILTGKVVVKYGDIEINADSIVLEKGKNQLFASGYKSGKIAGNPIFRQGAEEFESEELTYNFKTNRALIKNIISQISKPAQNISNNRWWSPLVLKHNIDLKKYSWTEDVTLKSPESKDYVLIFNIKHIDSSNSSASEAKDSSIMEDPILIVRENDNEYDFISAKTAIKSANNQILLYSGTMGVFNFNSKDLNTENTIPFDELQLDPKSNKPLIKNIQNQVP